MSSPKKTSSRRPKGKHIRIPIEGLLGALFLIIIIGLLAIFWNNLFPGQPTEEVCDLVDNDLDGEIDEGFSVTCTVDSDCGPNAPYGETYCEDGDVYRAVYESRCVGQAGSCLSECTNRQTETLVEECPDGCLRGGCV